MYKAVSLCSLGSDFASACHPATSIPSSTSHAHHMHIIYTQNKISKSRKETGKKLKQCTIRWLHKTLPTVQVEFVQVGHLRQCFGQHTHPLIAYLALCATAPRSTTQHHTAPHKHKFGLDGLLQTRFSPFLPLIFPKRARSPAKFHSPKCVKNGTAKASHFAPSNPMVYPAIIKHTHTYIYIRTYIFSNNRSNLG